MDIMKIKQERRASDIQMRDCWRTNVPKSIFWMEMHGPFYDWNDYSDIRENRFDLGLQYAISAEEVENEN